MQQDFEDGIEREGEAAVVDLPRVLLRHQPDGEALEEIEFVDSVRSRVSQKLFDVFSLSKKKKDKQKQTNKYGSRIVHTSSSGITMELICILLLKIFDIFS